MAAAFWIHLIFKMATGKPSINKLLHSSGHIHGLAEACINIDYRWQLCRSRDLSAAGNNFSLSRKANIRIAKII